MSESFGSMLRRHRLAASLTQEELAEQASLSPTAIAALERGRSRAPRLTTLRQLARTLDLSPEQLAELSRAVSTAGPEDLVEHDLARSGPERLVESGFEGLPRGANWLAPTAFLAHTCTIVGAVKQAGPLYDSLSAALSTVVRVGPLAGRWGPVDYHLGCLANLLGRPEEAETRLRRALALEQRMAARPFEARTRAELARVLSTSGQPGAEQMAEGTLALACSVGAAGIVREVEAAIGDHGTCARRPN